MTAEPIEREDDDFLAFWRAEEAKHRPETVRILGVDVVIPTDMPVMLQRLAEELSDSSRVEDMQRLMAVLFGQDLLDGWMDNGVTQRQLQVILKWGISNANGRVCTFAEALEMVRADEENEGKEPTPLNRADRRASSRTRGSATTGRSSSPISNASTRSRRTG